MTRMNLHAKYVSHLPAVVDALRHTTGEVLELGAGLSTFVLHWLCGQQGRTALTCETSEYYYEMVQHCACNWHTLCLIEDWDSAPIDRRWSVALIDHAPAERRRVEVGRLADLATVIIVHDCESRQAHHYSYGDLLDTFRYRRNYGLDGRLTVMVSNFEDVTLWT